MNPHTGELASLALSEMREGFTRLPDSLQDVARLKLAEAKRCGAVPKANTRGHHPLADWARTEKAKRKAKAASKARSAQRMRAKGKR